MENMFLIHNYPDMHRILGKVSVRFTDNADDYARALMDKDVVLATSAFSGDIPTAHLVEVYKKAPRAENTTGSDWTFVGAWWPAVEREQAFINKYGDAGMADAAKHWDEVREVNGSGQ